MRRAVCGNVHVAQPRPSTSGGQFAGRVSVAAATVVAAAVPAATGRAVLDVPGGFRFRKAVQILHDFPSGPMTIHGGRRSFFEVWGWEDSDYPSWWFVPSHRCDPVIESAAQSRPEGFRPVPRGIQLLHGRKISGGRWNARGFEFRE